MRPTLNQPDGGHGVIPLTGEMSRSGKRVPAFGERNRLTASTEGFPHVAFL